jgi:hypothetical protein
MKLVLAAGLTAATLVLSTGPALAAPYEWHETPTGLKNYIPYSIDPGGTALWTVGAFDDREGLRPAAAHWDGKAWQAIAQPTALGRLLDVDAIDGGDAWAVGSQQTPGDPTYQSRILAQRWNGKTWKVVPTPTFADGDSREFTSVAAIGNKVWALGYGSGGESPAAGFVYRYDGKQWTALNDEVIGSAGYPYDLEALAPNSLWVAAFDGVKHYDGKRWTQAKLPGADANLHLNDVEANSPTDVWAVGHREDPEFRRRPVAFHFDGRSWTQVATPAEGAELNSLSLVNGQPVAVGETRAAGPYILRLTKTGFERQADPAGASLLLTSAVTGGKLWVGGDGDGSGASDNYIGFTR